MKVFQKSGKLQKVSGYSGKFPDNLENFTETFFEILEEPEVPEDNEPGEVANKEELEDFFKRKNAPNITDHAVKVFAFSLSVLSLGNLSKCYFAEAAVCCGVTSSSS